MSSSRAGTRAASRRSFTRIARSSVATTSLLLACAGPAPCDGVDCPVALELGTGEEAFTPLGDTWGLVRGPQGLQHVPLAVRGDLPVGPVGRATVRAGLVFPDTRAPVADPVEVGVAAREIDGGLEIVGVILELADVNGWLGRPLGVEVTVAPVGEDVVGEGYAEAVVAWADEG